MVVTEVKTIHETRWSISEPCHYHQARYSVECQVIPHTHCECPLKTVPRGVSPHNEDARCGFVMRRETSPLIGAALIALLFM
jgi:hypothetical protein